MLGQNNHQPKQSKRKKFHKSKQLLISPNLFLGRGSISFAWVRLVDATIIELLKKTQQYLEKPTSRDSWYGCLRRTEHYFCGIPAKNSQAESKHEEISVNRHWRMFKIMDLALFKWWWSRATKKGQRSCYQWKILKRHTKNTWYA